MSKITTLDAIRTLLNVQGHATVAQIVKYAGLPYREVVDTLHRNRKLYELKNSRIVSLSPLTARKTRERQADFEAGKLYQIHKINYGVDTAIVVKQPELVESLGQSYTSGGLGDSITTKEILATEENIAVVEAAGVRPWGEWQDNDYRYWREDHEKGAK